MDHHGRENGPEHSLCNISVNEPGGDGKPRGAEPAHSPDPQRGGIPRERPSRTRAFRAAVAVAAVPVAVPVTVPIVIPTPPAERVGSVAITVAPAQETYDAQVMVLVNQRRAQSRCHPLRSDAEIETAAYEHSRDMGVNGYFGHDSQTGVTPWTRMRNAGYAYPAAENIARGYATPDDVVAGWMNDPAHRANLLNCAFKAAGVGYYSDAGTGAADRGPWWTEDFGYE
jgi:uncharacterized protein YkwD